MIERLYEDEEILVLDKPSGLASQPGEGVRISLVEAVERDYGFRPFLVHRLDKETSGCILVAKSSRAAARWSAILDSRGIRKVYRALTAGRPSGRGGVLDSPVPARGGAASARGSASASEGDGTQSARSRWRLVGSFGFIAAGSDAAEASAKAGSDGYSYLELELDTGRMHQLRLQLAAVGMPILGDDSHGDFALNKKLRREAGLKRMLLHSYLLILPQGVSARSPLPASFTAFLGRFADAPAADAPAAELS